ncbi:jg5315 [Pararge aegeria aegeria]|uniref:Jg5315 protein n=1 Tax=Pararge aegeria aegeria TaxID=348720 RepID=A0A8S4RB91_9NEOP|nr:jg5315 [Pararge aegeria aegeria]
MLRSVILVFVTIVNVAVSFSDVGNWVLPLNGQSCNFTLAKSLFKESQLIIALGCDVTVPTNITITYSWGPTQCSPDYFHYFEKRIVDCSNSLESATYDSNESAVLNVDTYLCTGKDVMYMHINKNKSPKDKKDAPDVQPRAPLRTVEKEGIYGLWMSTHSDKKFQASLHVEMLAPSGYLSAAIWPLLPFFGVMCGVYTVLCAAWLTVCALQWRDLLRIQFFNSEVYMFAEWVSVAKRALSRMLVIIVSLGFGIVKPRLGPALQRVVGTGLLWGLLAAIESWLRLHHKAEDSNRDLLLSEAPLSLLDSAICWWVFVSLAHTMRTLQLRRNSIKLSLYRHFTNTLIFAVIASVIFMLYSLKSYRIMYCITEWKDVWVDEAYWHILFAGVLGVIMVLWRPTNNNQRYAFTPLLDNAEDDDEEEEQFVNDAYGVKMRSTNIESPDSQRDQEPNTNSLDSDLRWVEENIPTSSLPLLDSDEEIINTKFEVSKMQ